MNLEELLKALPDDVILNDGEDDWTPNGLLDRLEPTLLAENVFWNGRSILRGASNGYIDPVPMFIRGERPHQLRGKQNTRSV